jgi:hypothetical protein
MNDITMEELSFFQSPKAEEKEKWMQLNLL